MPATTLSAVPQFSRVLGLSVDRSALKAVSLTQGSGKAALWTRADK